MQIPHYVIEHLGDTVAGQGARFEEGFCLDALHSSDPIARTDEARIRTAMHQVGLGADQYNIDVRRALAHQRRILVNVLPRRPIRHVCAPRTLSDEPSPAPTDPQCACAAAAAAARHSDTIRDNGHMRVPAVKGRNRSVSLLTARVLFQWPVSKPAAARCCGSRCALAYPEGQSATEPFLQLKCNANGLRAAHQVLYAGRHAAPTHGSGIPELVLDETPHEGGLSGVRVAQ